MDRKKKEGVDYLFIGEFAFFSVFVAKK